MSMGRFSIISLILSAIFFIAPVHANEEKVLLVTSVYNNVMDVIHLKTKKSIGTVTVGFVPHKMVVLPNTKLAYVANRGTKTAPGYSLSVIDLQTVKNVRTVNIGKGCGPHGIEEFSGKIYIACYDASYLKRYDPETDKMDWEVETGKNPHEVLVDPDHNKAYTANQSGDSISIIDIATKNRTDVPIKIGTHPSPITFTPDRKKLWIGTRSGEIYILNTITEKIETSFKVGDSLFDLKFTPDGEYVIAANLKPSIDKDENTFSFTNGKLILINPNTYKTEKEIILNNNMPINISFSLDGKYLYVSLPHTNNASGIELYNPDVDKIAKLNDQVGIIDLKNLTMVGMLKTATAPAHMLPISLSVSPLSTTPSFQMRKLQSIQTNNARGWDFFTIGDEKFLVAAEFTKDYPNGNKDIDSSIYKWSNGKFVPYQLIPTHGARFARHVEIDGKHYLLLVNSQTSNNEKDKFNVSSILYRWDGKSFQLYQSIPTTKNINLHFFKMNNDTYIAFAAGTHDEENSKTSESKIYKWDGKKFSLLQTIKTSSANNWENLVIDGKYYLIVANSYNQSDVFKWDGIKFNLYQSLLTKDARHIEAFELNGDYYLAVANLGGDSAIYQWDSKKNQFKLFQIIATQAARHWLFVKNKDKAYLVSSNFAHGINPNTPFDLIIYQFINGRFEKVSNLPIAGGAQQTLYFQFNNKSYLFVSVVFGASQLYEVNL